MGQRNQSLLVKTQKCKWTGFLKQSLSTKTEVTPYEKYSMLTRLRYVCPGARVVPAIRKVSYSKHSLPYPIDILADPFRSILKSSQQYSIRR